MRCAVACLALVLALGCGSPGQHALTPKQLAPLPLEESEFSIKNDSGEALSLQAYIWASGGDEPASDPREIKPGQEIKWAPFSGARQYVARNQRPASLQWLERPTPSTDYSIAVFRLGPDGANKRLDFQRFTDGELAASKTRPVRLVLGKGGTVTRLISPAN